MTAFMFTVLLSSNAGAAPPPAVSEPPLVTLAIDAVRYADGYRQGFWETRNGRPTKGFLY